MQTKHTKEGKIEVETEEVKNLILRWLMLYGEDWVDLETMVEDGKLMLIERNVLYLHSYVYHHPQADKLRSTPKALQLINHGL